jgi:anti-sigma regulatory factor (Ser/Thr protein kinase)
LDKVSISIPASPQYLQVVRLIATGLASRLTFTIDEIEDLKIGVDELAAYLTGTQGREGTLDIEFVIESDRIKIRGVGNFAPGDKIRTDLTEFSRQILKTVADEAVLEVSNGVPSFFLTKNKQS